MKKWARRITAIISCLLVIGILITSLINCEKIFLTIESIALTVTFTANLALNVYFIRQVEKLEVDNAKLIKIAEAKGVDIEAVNTLNIEQLISSGFINYDDKIMETVIDLMYDFEYEISNGGFTLYGPMNLDILTKPEELRRSIGTEKFTCRDEKLNDYLSKLQSELQVMANYIILHSYPNSNGTFNKMRWIEMQEEICTDKTFSESHLKSEKEAFEGTEKTIQSVISIYKEMINYWRKNRKVAEYRRN